MKKKEVEFEIKVKGEDGNVIKYTEIDEEEEEDIAPKKPKKTKKTKI